MTMKKIQPRGKWVLVRPVDPESSINEAGLYIPDSTEKEQKAQGTVEAVGSEINDIKKGDHVVYGAYAGETLGTTEKGKKVELKLLHDDDIIAFLK